MADGGVGWKDESSVPVDGYGEGESGEKNSFGDSLPLVKRTADARLENTSPSTGGLQGHPSESFSPPSPGRLSMGLKTQRSVLPRPPASGADCLFRQVRGGYCRGHYEVVISSQADKLSERSTSH